MKKILLSILCLLCISFSFAQPSGKNLKVNSAKTVEFLTKELKLDAKQKAIFMNAYGEYAANMLKAQTKAKMRPDGKAKNNSVEARKSINESMLRFSEKRDKVIYNCLKKKQSKLYKNIVRRINPFTIKLEEPKK
tara:strand:- start:962 stop:1366 length:405 start_codon:yes stop_codon:yes gene_type:complete